MDIKEEKNKMRKAELENIILEAYQEVIQESLLDQLNEEEPEEEPTPEEEPDMDAPQDTVLEDVNLVISGDLNLNGHTLTVPCGSVTVSGNFNGGGTLVHCGGLVVTGATQNNPTITQNCN